MSFCNERIQMKIELNHSLTISYYVSLYCKLAEPKLSVSGGIVNKLRQLIVLLIGMALAFPLLAASATPGESEAMLLR